MRQRFFISFLLSTTLLVYFFEHLPLQGNGLERTFAVSWFMFSLLVIGGNLQGLLHKRQRKFSPSVTVDKKGDKVRGYGR